MGAPFFFCSPWESAKSTVKDLLGLLWPPDRRESRVESRKGVVWCEASQFISPLWPSNLETDSLSTARPAHGSSFQNNGRIQACARQQWGADLWARLRWPRPCRACLWHTHRGPAASTSNERTPGTARNFHPQVPREAQVLSLRNWGVLEDLAERQEREPRGPETLIWGVLHPKVSFPLTQGWCSDSWCPLGELSQPLCYSRWHHRKLLFFNCTYSVAGIMWRTVNPHFSGFCICKFTYLLKCVYNPQVNTAAAAVCVCVCTFSHSQTCTEQQKYLSPWTQHSQLGWSKAVSSQAINKGPACGLGNAMFFTFGGFLWIILLFKRAPKHSTEVLSRVLKHKKAMMSLQRKYVR